MTRPRLEAPLRTRLAWIAAIAFASGFPFGFFNELLPVYLRAHGVGLAEIGLLSTLSLPWALKFLWAPFVDRIATTRAPLHVRFAYELLFDPSTATWLFPRDEIKRRLSR